MAFRDTWHRALVYFGLAEDHDYGPEYEEGYEPETGSEEVFDRGRVAVRAAPADARGAPVATRSTTSSPTTSRSRPPAPASCARSATAAPTSRSTWSFRRNFNDAQQVADQFKRSVPVILNLQTTDHELSKRMIDFSSGLTYALDGGMQRIAEKIFLLTPRNVEVSAEEKARLLDKGFFNQS